jgi:ABC-type molybdate transport system substrate-binding protein
MTVLRLLLASLFVLVAGAAFADDVKVLAAVGYKPVLGDLAPSYEKQSGNKVHVEYDSVSAIARRVANNEFFDIVISTQVAIE